MGLDSGLLWKFRRSLRQLLGGNPFPEWRTELFFTDRKGIRVNNQKTDITEYGLVLPNGQVLWNSYSNRSLATPSDRHTMVEVLRKTAEECGFTEEQFLSHYSWVSRRVKTEIFDLGEFSLTDSIVIGVDETPGSEDDGIYDDNDFAGQAPASADGKHGDFRPGSMGGAAPRSA